MKVFSNDSDVERMENLRIALRVYLGVCAGSRPVCRPRKRWIDSVKESLKGGNPSVAKSTT